MTVKKKAPEKKKEVIYVTIRKISNGFVVVSSSDMYGTEVNSKEVFCDVIEEVLLEVEGVLDGGR